MKTSDLTSETFDAVIGVASRPVLVDFHAEWCGPCRMLGPIIDQIASEDSESAFVARLDIDQAPDIASRFGITSIPTLIVFKDGKPVATSHGVQSKAAIRSLVALAS